MNIPSRTGATTGSSTGSRTGRRTTGHRARRAGYAGIALSTLATSLLVAPGIAQAAVTPLVAPDNIVTFPNRDMITLEGFDGRAGQNVKVEVFRGTQLMGAASGKIAAGAGFEINHPGGACWGNEAGSPQVTPDILAGDKIVVSFQDAGQWFAAHESIVQDAFITPEETPTTGVGLDYTDGATTFTVHGHIAAGIAGANIEQRIVNPDLTDTEVARRDIRALEGPMTPADRGGYSSSLVVDRATNSFVATYDFAASGPNAARNAAIAAASGGERVLAWERFDVDRMGLTIAEDDEPGGPGMGGCPMGPASVAPTAGEYHVNWGTDANGVTAQVLWGKSAAEPGAAALTGYSVEAVEKTDSNGDGERDVVGRRTGVDDVDTTLTGLHGASQDWEIEVRALTEAGAAGPLFPLATSTGGTPAPGTEVDGTVPTATFAIEAGKVALTSNEADAQIFYSVDGTDLLDASGQLKFGASVLHYTEPFAVAAENTTVKFVAIDAAGNASQQGTGTASPVQAGPPAAPGAPVGLTVTPSPTGLQALVVSWTAPANTGNLPISRYQIHVTAPAEGSTPAANQTLSTTDGTTTTRTIGGLVTGREYTVEVRAQNVETLADGTTRTRNGAYTTPAVKARPGDVVTGALVRNDQGDIRIAGSGSQRNVTLTIYRTTNAANVGNTANSTQVSPATVTNAVAPATGIDWEYRDRAGAPFPAGTVIWVRSSKGGVASFTV